MAEQQSAKVHPLTTYYFTVSIIDLERVKIQLARPDFYYLVKEYRLACDRKLDTLFKMRQIRIRERQGFDFLENKYKGKPMTKRSLTKDGKVSMIDGRQDSPKLRAIRSASSFIKPSKYNNPNIADSNKDYLRN